MKLLAFTFMLMFSASAFAGAWVAKSKIKNSKISYAKERICFLAEGEKCFNKGLKDMRRFKIGFRAVDVEKTRDCIGSAECQTALDDGDFTCPNGEVPSFDDKANWPALDFAAESRPASGFFLWCQKEILVADSAGASAADAEDAAKAAAKATRQSKKAEFDSELKNCVRVGLKGVSDLNPGTATTNQLANRQNKLIACFVSLLKDYAEPRLDPSDL